MTRGKNGGGGDSLLWRFAAYLAGGATPEQAAKWLGVPAEHGTVMLTELCARLGPQAR
jgi:hypothetical protein